ncbi:hypothetical protein [Xenorhabdus siamensis]|uniref:hypothetical protein n=1 Tax=Xenorhabdus siamensis TaxID=3136254 RepID=UPI0030F475CC
MRKKIVVSAINIVDGGALTILHQLINAISSEKYHEYDFIFLLSKKNVLKGISLDKSNNIKFIYYPLSKKSWFFRLYYEYIHLFFISLLLKPFVWFSLHDITPNVFSKKRYVYCHNPSIFIKFPIKDFLKDKKQFLFCLFYKFFYKINIRKNDNVIVQQNWIANEFQTLFDLSNVIIAKPIITKNNIKNDLYIGSNPYNKSKRRKIFYPAFPRYFKNHDILIKSAKHLASYCEFFLTINVNESNIIKHSIKNNNQETKGLQFLGRLNLR